VNTVLLYFISGESFYSGAALLLAVLVLSLFTRYTKLARLKNLITWFALILIIMAAPPFGWVFIGIFLAAFAIWYFFCNSVVHRKNVQTFSALILVALISSGIFMEYPRRALPRVTGPVGNHLVVIGDSISAGLTSQIAPLAAGNAA